MDTSRGVAVLLVILGHAVVMIPAVAPDPLEWIVDFFRPFRIPTLLLLSGLLLSRALAKPWRVYLNGKWQAVLWPFIVWNLVVWVLRPDRPELWDPTFWLQPAYLWFLLYLCGYYVIGLVLSRIHPAAILALLASCWMLTYDYLPAAEFFRYGIFFFVGHWIGRRRDGNLEAPTSPLLLVAGVVTVVYGVLHTMDVVDYRHPLAPFLNLICIAALVGACAFVDRRFNPRFLRWVGQNSLIFYVTHFPVVVIVAHLQALLWPAGGSFYWVLNLVAAIGCCAVATWMQRYAFARLPYRAPSFRRAATPTRARGGAHAA